jgi:hypothetical protein
VIILYCVTHFTRAAGMVGFGSTNKLARLYTNMATPYVFSTSEEQAQEM